MSADDLKPGYTVKAFHPGMVGVVKEGRVITVGRKYARVDFGLLGEARVAFRDVVEVVPDRT